MRKFDLTVQTLIIGSSLAVVQQATNEANGYWSILLVQLVLGPWQYISSLISVLAKASYWKLKCWHLALSSLYLTILFAIRFTVSSYWQVAYLIFIPWALAIYYYILTWKWVLNKKTKQSKFLPHISF